MPAIAQWKRDEVAKLTKMLVDSNVVGVAEIGGIPGVQMQEMRATLRKDVDIIGTKNRLLRLAIADAAKQRPGIEKLADLVDGQMAIIATDMNPFSLYKKLGAGATMAPLKGGQISPLDVLVKKGPTAFGPGPIVGEFQKAGIPAKIEGPKVAIIKDVTPVKAGEVVSADLALMLAKLEIKPVELKIDLKAAFELDTMFMPDVLAIDEDAVFAQIVAGIRTGIEVSLQTAFPTKESMKLLLTRAYKTSAALSLEAGVEFDAQASQAYAAMLAGQGKKPEDLSEELKERLGDALDTLSNVAIAAPVASEEPAEAEEEEEEVSEDDAAAGLGALFG